MKKSPAPPFIPDPDRPAEMPFDEIHTRIEYAVEKFKLPRVRHACRNAFNLLRKSWILHPFDSEMSLFCAITAEEEAATAVIRALRHQKYPNAQLLNDRNHVHKSAIWPFVSAVMEKMAEKNIVMPTLILRYEGDPRIDFSFDVGELAKIDQPLWATPDEPFNFVMTSDRTGPFKVHDFSEELLALATSKGSSSMEKFINSEANIRNKILYASEQGIPSTRFEDSYLLSRRKRVTSLLGLAIAVLQTDKHQLFLVQCLDALLRAVQRFEGDAPKFPALNRNVQRFELIEQNDGRMKLTHVIPANNITYRYTIN